MAALYELNEAIENFDLKVDDETGEIINLSELEELELEREEKVENIALWIKNLVAESTAIQAEMKNLRARSQAAQNKADRLKNYLTLCLGGKKFSTPRVSVSYRKSKAVNITDLLALPEKYQKVDIAAEKLEIKKALEAGEDVPGAELEERESTIIK